MTNLPPWLRITLDALPFLAVLFGLSLAHIKNTRAFKQMGLSSKDLLILYRFWFLGKGHPPPPVSTRVQNEPMA